MRAARYRADELFVADGIDSALEQARDAAGDKDVLIGGGWAIQQFLEAGLVDELQIHVVSVLLGAAPGCSTASAPTTSSSRPSGWSSSAGSPT